ncbi:MAG TPA: CehA/McbA family metallohydrolase [Candidatus Paceibacterota bacterium]|nr:CehA/McbA family metallohydrolase [Candidatus Paceibacterota bacterium]HSA03406.1 CehA/McbA family metallohydrolase [Candidatus Paceibacterota bacterium]
MTVTNAAAQAFLQCVIVDRATGEPASCNVALTDPAGKRVVERNSFQGGFRCRGYFEKSLPSGTVQLRVTRGPETLAFEKVLQLAPGQAHEIRVELERQVDLRSRGWFSGDSHAHMIHDAWNASVDFDYVALAAQAEDLQYLSLAQQWTIDRPTPEALEAELNARSRQDCVLTWNLEAPKNYYRGDATRCLGHCWTWVMPGRTRQGDNVISMLFEASAGDYESQKPSYANFESHELIRHLGGRSFYSHPFRWWTGPWGGQGGYPHREKARISNLAVELPLDTLLGPTYDGLDVMTTAGEYSANAKAFELWAMLLNRGYRLAATASSDSCFDRANGAVPGSVRTYTFLDKGFSLEAVAEATAKGRTFVTTGPLIVSTLEGLPPGSVFQADGRNHRLAMELWAAGNANGGLSHLELIRNGAVVQTLHLPPGTMRFQTNQMIRATESSWYSLRLYGSDPQRQRAISGAFYFEKPGQAPPAPVMARVRARIVEDDTGKPLSGRLIEVQYLGNHPRDGRRHRAPGGHLVVSVPGTARLRAEAPGYKPVVLSPFFDHPALLEKITLMTAEDLAQWETFEQIRSLLSDVPLTFRLKKSP